MNELNFILLFAFGCLLLMLFLRNSVNKLQMIQYPFLMTAVMAGWAFPQMIGLAITGAVPSEAITKTTIYTAMCVLLGVAGYASTRKTYKMADWSYSRQRLERSAAVLMIVGGYFFYKYSSMAAEATLLYGGFWTGKITIYVFLASMLKIGYVVAIAANLQKPSLANITMIIIGTLMYLQRVLIYGRRQAAIELLVIMLVFLWRKYNWLPSRILLIGVFVIGALFVNAAGAYRGVTTNVITDRNFSAVLLDVAKIDFLGLFTNNLTDPDKNQELRNAALTIDAAERRSTFDAGLSFWNSLVLSFVPGQIIGHDLKQGLMFSLEDVAYEEFGHTAWAGTTQTGMATSFRSFWYFGAFVFFIIGYVMRRWFQSVRTGSPTGLIMVMLINSESLLAITHTHNDFFMVFIQLALFLFPALYFSRIGKKPV